MNHAGDKCTEWALGRCGSLGAALRRSGMDQVLGGSCHPLSWARRHINEHTTGAASWVETESRRDTLVFSEAVPDHASMSGISNRPSLRIRIVFRENAMIGPGKAELLERIDRCGSIAAAGREMGMSYKRAWELVGTLNAIFREPVLDSTRGGSGGGGAVLTEAGREILALYRAFEQATAEAGATQLAALQSRLSDVSKEK